MKKLSLAVLTPLLLSGSVMAGESIYKYSEMEGTLTLSVSEESGDVSVELFTVNPNTGSDCGLDPIPCNPTDEGLTCFTEEGLDPVQIRFEGENLEVLSFPFEYCGLNAMAVGKYIYQGSGQ